jgi:uncharacterized metal-binding protein
MALQGRPENGDFSHCDKAWLPYRGIMKHRSIFSHLPFVGTLIRTSYLVISITLIVCLITYIMLFVLGIKTHQNIFLVMKNSFVMTFKVILQIKRDYITQVASYQKINQ